ncbi:MAG TPA: ATP-binding protein [Candidatus Limnocylindria bacterium]|nr:ATP-binding protein [Candidatus Limnocylindria bacterium]
MAGATERAALDEVAALPRELLHGSDPEAALLSVLDGLARAFGYERSLVALSDDRARVIRGRFGRGITDEIAEAFQVPLANLQDPSVVAFHTGVPQRVDDVRSDDRITPSSREILTELGFEAFVVAALRGSGSPPIGVVLLSKGAPASDADVQDLVPFASQAGSILAQARDVVELRQGGEAHAVEKEWLWWMVNAFADPVVVTDDQNELVLANHSADLLFKKGKDDSAGKAHAISMNNFLFTAGLSTWNLQSASERTRELTLVDPIEGDELIFEVITSPATNYRIGARGTVSVLKNVTDLRHVTQELSANIQRLQSADQEIRMERDRLDLVLRNVPNPIIVVDNMNEIVSMNAAAERLFKPPRDPLIQSRRAQVAMRNDAKFTSFLAQLSLDPAPRRSGELRLTDVDTGEVLEMQVNANEVRDPVGATVATVSVMQDVGRLRELERRRLEQALFDSEKLAATGRLAASIAHEINNPLEAIQNALYLLVKRIPEDDPNAKFLAIAMKETERMSRILRQMLGFYRPAANLALTDLNALIEEAEALVAKRLRERNVKVEKQLQPDLAKVMASSDQIKQVILNLVLNAAEAMPNGGIITVSTESHRDAGSGFIRTDAVRVQVADTGPGIAEEYLPHIFEPFFSTKGGKGTGLGLWVSLGIAQSHGGRLQVRNRPGGGTVFSMTLPIGGPPADAV